MHFKVINLALKKSPRRLEVPLSNTKDKYQNGFNLNQLNYEKTSQQLPATSRLPAFPAKKTSLAF